MRGLFLCGWLLWLGVARAQGFVDDDPVAARPAAEAQALLARPLPVEAGARLDLLLEQVQAARYLSQRAAEVALARRLVEEGRGHPDWPGWVRSYLSSEFTWGQSGKALEACEAWVNDPGLVLGLRAGVALRQTYMAAQEGELTTTLNHWRRAQSLWAAVQQAGGEPDRWERYLGVDALQVRAEVERLRGEPEAAVATLREAIREAQGLQAHYLHERLGNPRHPDVEQAASWLDGSRGMLVYALVRLGRAAEALELANEQARRAQRGDLNPARGMRWHYRRAHALNALQRHGEALEAADFALRLLGEAQVSASSHTGHLALAERLRALLGLRRWAEADAAYLVHLEAVAGDRLATARARNPALAVLLAAQAGRLDEAWEQSERSLRYRERLYGPEHAYTQEMAGVRGVVRLARGEHGAALADFERLFAVALDQPAGWLDLDQRGLRGYVLGWVFDAFLRHVVTRAAQSDRAPLEPALMDRALQIADRLKLGQTQRALQDASSRLRAGSPALREALDAEQAARRLLDLQHEVMQQLLADEDALRRQMATAAFKTQPLAVRQTAREGLESLRARAVQQQAQVQAARMSLQRQRERVAAEHPRYAELIAPRLPGTAALGRWLQAGEALLVVHALEPATLVWLLRPQQPPLWRVLPLGEAALAESIEAWRRALDRSAQLGRRSPVSDWAAVVGPAHALHEQLLGPWRRELDGVESLLVASSGPLARVPLAALARRPWQPGHAPAWLVRDMAVTQLPAAASLQALRHWARDPEPTRALMGFGDPLFATAPSASKGAGARLLAPSPRPGALRWDEQQGLRYADIPPLPDTRTELWALAKALGADPRSDLRLGREATRSAVLSTDLSDRRVLAFATHGLLPGEWPGLSKPALAMAAEGEASPLLELDDVLTLRLRAHWVLLSACNTAAAQPAAEGDQAMSGLVRAFFFAGARSVLATHWAVESEPNRSDCLSVLGIARDVAALTGAALTLPAQATVEGQAAACRTVRVEQPSACPRYSGRVIQGVNAAAPTPGWMVRRLERSGLRCVSAVVDITNYVLLERGQPLHAFDLEKLSGDIVVRNACADEQLVLLNGQNVTLQPDMLVIADGSGPVALAGIMGGEPTSVSDATRDIFLESAFFAPAAITGKARRLGFSTDSSYRFERGVDFAATRTALDRATELILEICGGQAGTVTEFSAQLPQRSPIRLRVSKARDILGIPLDQAVVARVFERLRFPCEASGDVLHVTPPSYRFDLAIEEDLVEEIVRMHGYEHVPALPPVSGLGMLPSSEGQLRLADLRHSLVSADYREAVTYSFVDEAWERNLQGNEAPIRLRNPIASNMGVMRSGMWGGLIDALRYNLNRRQERVRLFEVGACFAAAGDGFAEVTRIAGLCYGSPVPEQWGEAARDVDFFDIKADVDMLTGGRARYEAAQHPALHPGQSARVLLNGQSIGWLGGLHPQWQQYYQLPRGAMLFELEVAPLLERGLPVFSGVAKFPPVRRDLAFVVDESLPVQALLDTLCEARTDAVKEIALFDQYRGNGIDSGKKSLAFLVVMQDTQKTLTDEEADAGMGRLVNAAAQKHGAVLRS